MDKFVRFGVVGAAAFVVDTAILYIGLYLLGLGYYIARFLSFMVAVTFTWYCNKVFTFKDAAIPKSLLQQWFTFVLANSVGGAVNLTIYSSLIYTFPIVRDYPVLGVAAGSIGGLLVNFFLSKRYVFKQA